ncbi:MAG: DUF2029 domain-containing protein [Leptospiraceae bacterium]|nr:DUF2029 domain-containing protein [Leptospiraceae bacterium]MDW7976445.1 glycosyltransferase family 87 protein [Leptospiraceae bacterium]
MKIENSWKSIFLQCKQKILLIFLKYKNIYFSFGVLFLVLLINSLEILSPTTQTWEWKSRSDFEDYYHASLRIRNHQSPYYEEKIEWFLNHQSELPSLLKEGNFQKLYDFLSQIKGIGTYLYPPLFGFLIIPLTFFSYEVAGMVFQIFQLLILGVSLWLLYQLAYQLGVRSKRKILRGILLSLVFTFPYLIQNSSNGNIGFFLIFFLVLTLNFFYYSKNFTLDFVLGVFVGFTMMIKIITGFIVLFFFIQRRYSVLLGTFLGIFLAIFLPSLYLGWEKNWEFFRFWYELIMGTYQEFGFVRPYTNNQSLSGALGKLFLTFADFKQHLYGLPLVPLSFETIKVLITSLNSFVLGVLLVLSFAFWIFSFKDQNLTLYYLYFLFLSALLTSGISWYHTFGILIVAYFFYFLKHDEIHHGLFVFPSIFVWILMFLPYGVRDFFSIYSFFTWINFGIWIFLAFKLFGSITFVVKNQT